MSGQRQRRFEQRRRIQIITDKRAEQAHFLLHQRTLVAMREHRIEVDHLWRLPLPTAHQLDGVTGKQAHARHDGRHIEVQCRTLQAVLQQRRHQRLALDQGHLAAQAGQHERVTPQPRSRVENPWPNARLHAHRLGDHLPTAAAELAPMRRRPLDEIHPYRARGLVAQLDQLQPVITQLQGELGLAVLPQAQARCPLSGRCGVLGVKGLDTDAGVVPLVGHWLVLLKNHSKHRPHGRYRRSGILPDPAADSRIESEHVRRPLRPASW